MKPRLDTNEGFYVGDDYVHRINYEELISLSIYVIQQQKQEIDSLKEKVDFIINNM